MYAIPMTIIGIPFTQITPHPDGNFSEDMDILIDSEYNLSGLGEDRQDLIDECDLEGKKILGFIDDLIALKPQLNTIETKYKVEFKFASSYSGDSETPSYFGFCVDIGIDGEYGEAVYITLNKIQKQFAIMEEVKAILQPICDKYQLYPIGVYNMHSTS